MRCDPRSDIFALGRAFSTSSPPGSCRSAGRARWRSCAGGCIAIRCRRVPSAPPCPWLQEDHPALPRGRRAQALRVRRRGRVRSRQSRAGRAHRARYARAPRRRGASTLRPPRCRARSFEPAPCPPLARRPARRRSCWWRIDSAQDDEAVVRGDARRGAAPDAAPTSDAASPASRWCRPRPRSTGEGDEDTATGRHIKHLVELRRWAKPLELPEERVTYHVLESDKPAAALIDYATMNEVDQILIGAPRDAARALVRRSFAQVVAEAPCSVTVVRPRPDRTRAIGEGERMSEFETQGAAFRRAVHARACCCSTIPILALFNVSGHAARRAGPLRLHLHRLGGADRVDGAASPSRAASAERTGAACCSGTVIILTSFAYLGLLFAIAYYADQRADAGRSVIASPYIYSLSLAVYATAWTFYGSVGRAASDGVGFLPIYIGPTLMIALWWVVMRKILRISKQNRITSLADFIASRYGKSALLGGPRHRHRRDRHPALHLAAAEGGLEQLLDPGPVPGDRHAGAGRRDADARGHGAVGGADPRRVHDRLRHAPPRRGRAPPGHGRRDRVRIAGQAARVPRGRRVRHLRHLQRLRRSVRARRGRARSCAR